MPEARRDLLEVVRHEHDRPPALGSAARPSGRRGASRGRARSRLAAGSSSRSRSGSGISARAIETRRRSPADSVPNGWSAPAAIPTPAEQARARARSSSVYSCHHGSVAALRAVMTRSTGVRSGRRTSSTALPAEPIRCRSVAGVDLAVARAEDLDGPGGRPQGQPDHRRAAWSCPSRSARSRPSARPRGPASRAARGWSGRTCGRRGRRRRRSRSRGVSDRGDRHRRRAAAAAPSGAGVGVSGLGVGSGVGRRLGGRLGRRLGVGVGVGSACRASAWARPMAGPLSDGDADGRRRRAGERGRLGARRRRQHEGRDRRRSASGVGIGKQDGDGLGEPQPSPPTTAPHDGAVRLERRRCRSSGPGPVRAAGGARTAFRAPDPVPVGLHPVPEAGLDRRPALAQDVDRRRCPRAAASFGSVPAMNHSLTDSPPARAWSPVHGSISACGEAVRPARSGHRPLRGWPPGGSPARRRSRRRSRRPGAPAWRPGVLSCCRSRRRRRARRRRRPGPPRSAARCSRRR